MIRPSQAVVGRTTAASATTRMSEPGATPSTGPKGISSALESRKPTTSAGRASCPPERPISARDPTESRESAPRASISRPDTAATLPVTTSGSTARTAETR